MVWLSLQSLGRNKSFHYLVCCLMDWEVMITSKRRKVLSAVLVIRRMFGKLCQKCYLRDFEAKKELHEKCAVHCTQLHEKGAF